MSIILRAVLMYLFAVLFLRVTTRRIMRTATPLDLAVVFMLSRFCVEGVLEDDRSLTASLIGLGAVVLTHLCLFKVKARLPSLAALLDGTPMIVYANGQWDDDRMNDIRINKKDVISEMRHKGLRSLDEVEYAVIEHNGGISIIPRKRGIDQGPTQIRPARRPDHALWKRRILRPGRAVHWTRGQPWRLVEGRLSDPDRLRRQPVDLRHLHHHRRVS